MLSEARTIGAGFFDNLVPACGPGFAAFLRKCPRVIVYLSGACPDKYIFNSLRRRICIRQQSAKDAFPSEGKTLSLIPDAATTALLRRAGSPASCRREALPTVGYQINGAPIKTKFLWGTLLPRAGIFNIFPCRFLSLLPNFTFPGAVIYFRCTRRYE